ncbi:hypothetical protein EON62_06180, partial [archaeon]
VCGSGSAGMGVAQSLYDAMLQEGAEPDEARNRFWVLDKDGLLGPERARSTLSPAQSFFAREHAGGLQTYSDVVMPTVEALAAMRSSTTAPGAGLHDGASLFEVTKAVRPTILLGLTGVGGTFTEEVVREMASHTARPIIFPLSNPTSHAECTAEQAYTWSEGRAVVASGSPFGPVTLNGRTITPSQTNNMYMYVGQMRTRVAAFACVCTCRCLVVCPTPCSFPGIGLGATAVRANRITDRMFYSAARALAEMVTEEQLDAGMVLPPIREIRKVSARVAAAVASSGISDGIVKSIPETSDLVRYMSKAMYDPRYYPLVNK